MNGILERDVCESIIKPNDLAKAMELSYYSIGFGDTANPLLDQDWVRSFAPPVDCACGVTENPRQVDVVVEDICNGPLNSCQVREKHSFYSKSAACIGIIREDLRNALDEGTRGEFSKPFFWVTLGRAFSHNKIFGDYLRRVK